MDTSTMLVVADRIVRVIETDRPLCVTSRALKHLKLARESFAEVRSARVLRSQGKWETWYRGDRKMNLPDLESLTDETIAMLERD